VRVKRRGAKGERDGGQCLFVAARWCGREAKGGGGSEGRHRVEGKTGKREGAQVQRGTARVASIGPRPTGAGGGAVARQGRASDAGDSMHERLSDGVGRQRGPVGSDGVRERVRESRAARWWLLTRGPGLHSAGRRG
jgi:hypothetical protein